MIDVVNLPPFLKFVDICVYSFCGLLVGYGIYTIVTILV